MNSLYIRSKSIKKSFSNFKPFKQNFSFTRNYSVLLKNSIQKSITLNTSLSQPKLFYKYYSNENKSIRAIIEEQIKSSPVVVYMKGTKERPQCGFSRAVVEVLRREGVKDYQTYNVLEDELLRQGIKDFTNWPTIPQVYIGGEFVGGCDIILEMHQDGSLTEKLEANGVELENK